MCDDYLNWLIKNNLPESWEDQPRHPAFEEEKDLKDYMSKSVMEDWNINEDTEIVIHEIKNGQLHHADIRVKGDSDYILARYIKDEVFEYTQYLYTPKQAHDIRAFKDFTQHATETIVYGGKPFKMIMSEKRLNTTPPQMLINLPHI